MKNSRITSGNGLLEGCTRCQRSLQIGLDIDRFSRLLGGFFTAFYTVITVVFGGHHKSLIISGIFGLRKLAITCLCKIRQLCASFFTEYFLQKRKVCAMVCANFCKCPKMGCEKGRVVNA
jgi:hypothetical protein